MAFVASNVSAQVVMDVPFVPVAVSDMHRNNAASSLSGQVTYKGKDENGADVYATDWVEVPANQFGPAVDDDLASPNSSAKDVVGMSGFTIDGLAGKGYRAFDGGGSDAITGGGICRKWQGSSYNATGLGVSTSTPVQLYDCMNYIATWQGTTLAAWSAARNFYFVSYAAAPFATCINQIVVRVNNNVGPGPTAAITGDMQWSSVEAANNCDIPLPIPKPSPMTNKQAVEMEDPDRTGTGAGQNGLPEQPPRGFTPLEVNNIIINNISNVTNITNNATSHTNSYQAAGNIGAVPGGYRDTTGTSPPSTVPREGTKDTEQFCARNSTSLMCVSMSELLSRLDAGEGGETISEFCASNPDAGMCAEGGGGGIEEFCTDHPDAMACLEDGDETAFDAAQSAADTAEDNLLAAGNGFLTELGEFSLGEGPTVGPVAGACPMAGGIEVEGTDIVIDTDTLCEVAGGPMKTLILMLSMISAAIILLRGAAA